MKEHIYETWNSVMDSDISPLKNIPSLHARHLIMQILAWMWCIAFGMIVNDMLVGVASMMAHIVLLSAIVITVATFETAKKSPDVFKRIDGYNGRQNNGEHN